MEEHPEIVTDEFGYQYRLGEELSRGGQGIVYRTQTPNTLIKVLADSETGKWKLAENLNKGFQRLRTLPLPEHIHITVPQATLRGAAGYVMTLLGEMDCCRAVFDSVAGAETEDSGSPVPLDKENGSPAPVKAGQDSNHLSAEIATLPPELAGQVRIHLSSPMRAQMPPELAEQILNYLFTGGARRRLEVYCKCALLLSQLHMQGLVYCDFSRNTLFVSENKVITNVWLIDADNIDYASEVQNSDRMLTPGYAAPEAYYNKMSFYSDCYSFALAAFEDLFGCAPFNGVMLSDESGLEDEENIGLAQRGELPYILDSEDDRNHCEGNLFLPQLFSEQLLSLFDQTFSARGRKRPQSRPTMPVWAHAMAWEHDHQLSCPHCGLPFYWQPGPDGASCQCSCCDGHIPLLVLRSCYDREDGNSLCWEHVHELCPGQEFSVSSRLTGGVRLDEARLLRVRCEKDRLRLTLDTAAGFVMSVLDRSGFFEGRGEVRMDRHVWLKFENSTAKQLFFVEGTVLE